MNVIKEDPEFLRTLAKQVLALRPSAIGRAAVWAATEGVMIPRCGPTGDTLFPFEHPFLEFINGLVKKRVAADDFPTCLTAFAMAWQYVDAICSLDDAEIPQDCKNEMIPMKKAIATYFAAQRALRGFRGGGLASTCTQYGCSITGLDFFNTLPSEEELRNAATLPAGFEGAEGNPLSTDCQQAVNNLFTSDHPFHKLAAAAIAVAAPGAINMMRTGAPMPDPEGAKAVAESYPKLSELQPVLEEMGLDHLVPCCQSLVKAFKTSQPEDAASMKQLQPLMGAIFVVSVLAGDDSMATQILNPELPERV